MSVRIPETSDIIGGLVLRDRKVFGDANCDRVELLFKEYLKKVAKSDGGWTTLCRDPEDGRYWEYTFLESHMQGGGAPSLILMDEVQLQNKYGSELFNNENA